MQKDCKYPTIQPLAVSNKAPRRNYCTISYVIVRSALTVKHQATMDSYYLDNLEDIASVDVKQVGKNVGTLLNKWF